MGPEDDSVEVVYALPEEQHIVRVPFEPGMTAEQAVHRSELITRFPEIAARPLVLGLFGSGIAPARPLVPGDRVEICRPLRQDPRELRRTAAKTGKVSGSDGASSGDG